MKDRINKLLTTQKTALSRVNNALSAGKQQLHNFEQYVKQQEVSKIQILSQIQVLEDLLKEEEPETVKVRELKANPSKEEPAKEEPENQQKNQQKNKV